MEIEGRKPKSVCRWIYGVFVADLFLIICIAALFFANFANETYGKTHERWAIICLACGHKEDREIEMPSKFTDNYRQYRTQKVSRWSIEHRRASTVRKLLKNWRCIECGHKQWSAKERR